MLTSDGSSDTAVHCQPPHLFVIFKSVLLVNARYLIGIQRFMFLGLIGVNFLLAVISVFIPWSSNPSTVNGIKVAKFLKMSIEFLDFLLWSCTVHREGQPIRDLLSFEEEH